MTYILTMAFIFALLVAGIAIDKLYHRFARHNPQLGPFRPEGMHDCCSCSAGSGCSESSCSATAAPVHFHRN